MQPAAAPPASEPRAPKLSNLALWSIAAIAIIAMAGVFAYILFVSGLPFTTQLWWMGITGLILALAYYLVYAATGDRKITRPMAEALFVIGMGCFYGSVAVGPSDNLTKLIFFVLISILLVIVLVAIFMMARGAERDAIRKSQRRLTP